MMGHKICFNREIWKIIPKLSLDYPRYPFLSGALKDMKLLMSNQPVDGHGLFRHHLKYVT